jgi:putative redox protein
MSRPESLSFPNSRGELLAAVLHHPERTGDRGVVVAHGMLSSKDSPKHREICERLAAAGILALRFDFSGRGSSGGDPEDLRVSQEVDDLVAAAAALRSGGATRLGAVGSSLGGTVAILTAGRIRGLAALVTVAGPSRLPEAPRPSWGLAGFDASGERVEVAPGQWIRSRFFDDARRHDVLAAARRVLRPWRIIHGQRDEVVPVASAHELAAASPTAELLVHPEAGHRFAEPSHRRWLVDRIVDFLAARLGSESREGPVMDPG